MGEPYRDPALIDGRWTPAAGCTDVHNRAAEPSCGNPQPARQSWSRPPQRQQRVDFSHWSAASATRADHLLGTLRHTGNRRDRFFATSLAEFGVAVRVARQFHVGISLARIGCNTHQLYKDSCPEETADDSVVFREPAGMVACFTPAFNDAASFGGFKRSEYGRELSRFGMGGSPPSPSRCSLE